MRRLLLAVLSLIALTAASKKPATAPAAAGSGVSDKTFAGLELRSIGPALTSGRVIDLAVDPHDPRIYYVAAASGGVWKTTNSGTTFTPIFDDQPSFSIGCVTVDPSDSLTVWVGTGENNSQRSVSVGDGIYKSTDGGKSWKNMGLSKSEHIGKIVVDPRNSSVVYVAAQGPLWAPGGDRGLYKSIDGGKSWKPSLTISENTGVSDIAFDPMHPDVLYVSAYQRRRHVYSMVDGGPEAAIYKSSDAGATWNKLTTGLPKVDLGRIGLAVAPSMPNTVYAVIEASRGEAGFFRSRDGGGNWEKMSPYTPGASQYFQEIFVDPKNADRVYSVDVWVRVTEDGGKSFHKLDEKTKHPDSHVVWIDPQNSDHLLIGCDGGLYETFDRAATWSYKANLPLTQFYRVEADDALPFYNVYGGTQDNFSLGGPSRTTTAQGITNSDWFITLGGDGFRSVPDQTDPNIIYAESQNGGLARFDRRTGEALDIQPLAGKGMDPLRLNWDSPIIISPHSHTRLYFAAQYLFRSDDQGSSWRPVSGDLTRHLDRSKLPVMGRIQDIDAPAKSASTSFYGNIVSLAESPLQEGLLYVGTDDGLLQITEDGGAHWRKIEHLAGVPDMTYVSRLEASSHDANTVYAAFDNHKTGDFKPYLLKSTDRGVTWKSITADLPSRGSSYAIVEDPVDAKLLFAGTEYGLFVSQTGGSSWVQLKGGLPTIAVRDLFIQKRNNDLVLATFGRGFYILDDYSPLRTPAATVMASEATVFAPRDTPLYVERTPLGLPGKSFQGDTYYTAPNPAFGTMVTYYLKDDLKSRKKRRWEETSKLQKDKENEPPPYPTWEQLRIEERELEPSVSVIISDEEGNTIRRITAPATAGFHRVAWDLRYPPPSPIELTPPEVDPFNTPPQGPVVAPGTYSLRFVKRVDGSETAIGEAKKFNVVPLYLGTMNPADRASVLSFQLKASRLQRAVMGAVKADADALTRIRYIRSSLDQVEGRDAGLMARVNAIETGLRDIDLALNGDAVIKSHNEPVPSAIVDFVSTAVNGLTTTSAPTETHREALSRVEAAIGPLLDRLRKLIEVDLAGVEKQMNTIDAPWTPGRVPEWKAQ